MEGNAEPKVVSHNRLYGNGRVSEILGSSTECLRVPKAGSQISRLPVESSRKRRKSARAPIPCKHLQWICELFKRLNSLKNLVCTGVVCHRLRPPQASLAYIPRGAGGSSLPQTTKTISPPPSTPLRSLTLCISNN